MDKLQVAKTVASSGSHIAQKRNELKDKRSSVARLDLRVPEKGDYFEQ